MTDAEVEWRGELRHVHQRYVLGQVRGAAVDLANLVDEEREVYRAHRWWSLDELRASTETLLPIGLPELLADILRGALGGGRAGAVETPLHR